MNSRDKFGNSACHYAAEDGKTELLVHLIKNNADVNALVQSIIDSIILADVDGLYEYVHHLATRRHCSVL